MTYPEIWAHICRYYFTFFISSTTRKTQYYRYLRIKSTYDWRCDEVRIRQRSNFEHFQQIWNSTNVLIALLSNANLWRNPCSKTDFICTESHRGQTTLFFLKSKLSHKLQLLNVQHNFCLVMCYTVLIGTLILLILGNNILFQII